MDISCYETVIGLARCACPCIEDEAPEGFNDSDSGLFITDLAPLDALEGLDDCNTPGNPWEILANAREQAILAFISDVSALMMQRNKLARQPFRDGIGEGYARDTVTPSGAYAGIRIRCAPVRHGLMTLEKIGCIFDQTGTVAVSIYNRFNELVSGPHNVSAVGGKLTELSVNIDLPPYTPWADAQEYFLVYQVDSDNLPRANKIHCGCGGSPQFNTSQPFHTSQAKYGWANWVKVGGWSGDTLTDFDQAAESTSATQILNGLTIRVKITCDASKVLCEGTSMDFTQPLSAASAHAIRYKTASIVAAYILADTSLNRQNLINRETLVQERKRWDDQYEVQAAYIAEHVDITAGGCLFCKSGVSLKNNAVLT